MLKKEGLLRKGGYLRHHIKEILKEWEIPFKDDE